MSTECVASNNLTENSPTEDSVTEDYSDINFEAGFGAEFRADLDDFEGSKIHNVELMYIPMKLFNIDRERKKQKRTQKVAEWKEMEEFSRKGVLSSRKLYTTIGAKVRRWHETAGSESQSKDPRTERQTPSRVCALPATPHLRGGGGTQRFETFYSSDNDESGSSVRNPSQGQSVYASTLIGSTSTTNLPNWFKVPPQLCTNVTPAVEPTAHGVITGVDLNPLDQRDTTASNDFGKSTIDGPSTGHSLTSATADLYAVEVVPENDKVRGDSVSETRTVENDPKDKMPQIENFPPSICSKLRRKTVSIKDGSLDEDGLRPDILIWPLGMETWVSQEKDSIAEFVMNDNKYRLRRMEVLSSFEDSSSNLQLLLEVPPFPKQTDLAKTNLFYYFLACKQDIALYIHKSTGKISATGNSDDYELLRNLEDTLGRDRWWVLYAENIACLSCVMEIRQNRKTPWRIILNKLLMRPTGSYSCNEKYHIKCNHQTEINRFFEAMKSKDPAYIQIQKVRLRVEYDKALNPDTLACAFKTITQHLPTLKDVEIHLSNSHEIRKKSEIRRMLRCLKPLLAHLPRRSECQLEIRGLENHPHLDSAWSKVVRDGCRTPKWSLLRKAAV